MRRRMPWGTLAQSLGAPHRFHIRNFSEIWSLLDTEGLHVEILEILLCGNALAVVGICD